MFKMTNLCKFVSHQFMKMLKKNREIYLFVCSVILSKNPINSHQFLNHWESQYKDIADPYSEEVVERISVIKNSIDTDSTNSDFNLLELGAGYGRITKTLVKKFNVTSLEPDNLLFDELKKINRNSVKSTFQEIHKSFDKTKYFDIAFSVRSLEYLNLLELIIFLRRLSKMTKVLICWENSISIRRVAIASFFANNIKS
jgi:hypothetical protein